MVEDIIVNGNTRSHQFGDTALHQLFRQFRIFQLVADSNTFTGTDQFGQIAVERMMRETGHFNRLSRSVRLLRLYDTQYFGSGHGIFAIHFVKVAYTE